MPRRLLINEFAARAGVTVKALHLYDRLGVLVPARSEAGHRLYAPADLRRLGHIVALKRLGVPLRRIATILNGSGAPLHDLLRHQRRALEDRRDALDRLVEALRETENTAATRSAAEILDSLLERMNMQDSVESMHKYYSAEAWPEARAYYERWPSEAWRRLYREVIEALEQEPALDPASDLAQSLAARWLTLDETDAGHASAGMRLGLRRAWADRKGWPEALRARFDELEGERVLRFLAAALWERWDAERIEREDRTGVRAHVSEARRRLYQDGKHLLDHDPASAPIRQLLARWEAIVDEECGGDAELKEETIRSFKARGEWPAGLVRTMASSYGLDADTWLAVAALLHAAHDQRVVYGSS